MNLANFTKPSRYIDHEINAVRPPADQPAVRFALAFPDIYDIGMSHLGCRILYDIVNGLTWCSAERFFAPWPDLEAYLRSAGAPLTSLESGRPLAEFDIVGFSLQYELSYPTVLNMLDLGKIPVRREDRGNGNPLVIAGGPTAVNPAPLSRFMDAFVIGDAEDAISEVLTAVREAGGKREAALRALARVDGVYVPGFSSGPVKRRIVLDLEHAPYPTAPVVPYTRIVHDRLNIEVSRGCSQGCRFCQAGMIYRPVRERTPGRVLALAEESIRKTGYDEVSFTSLSAGDYSCMVPLLTEFNRRFADRKVAVSLPSLRIGAITPELLEQVRTVRKAGFTIAPEAATDRLRTVINKDFQEEDYDRALHTLFEAGWQTIKLYFMIGLPTETDEDVQGIIRMAQQALRTANRHKVGRVTINVGISPFVPKAHTPFQWDGQDSIGRLKDKKYAVLKALSKRAFTVKSHDEEMSFLEAAISRGDEQVGGVIEAAWRAGARLDGWSEHFNFAIWESAMASTGIDLGRYAHASLETSASLPWEVIDTGVRKEFLQREHLRSRDGGRTPNCAERCHACGLDCRSREFLVPEGQRIAGGEPDGIRKRHLPVRLRVRFSKTGPLRYLSHLELMSAVLRGLRRAKVQLSYSEGFHPSPKVAFGPALGVGVEGGGEYFDMEVFPPFSTDTMLKAMQEAMPEGLQAQALAPVDLRAPSLSSFIDCHEYVFTFPDAGPVARFIEERGRHPVYRDMIIDSAIMDGTSVRVVFRETAGAKVKMSTILAELFGATLATASVRRTGLWGFAGRPVSPLETAALPGPAGGS